MNAGLAAAGVIAAAVVAGLATTAYDRIPRYRRLRARVAMGRRSAVVVDAVGDGPLARIGACLVASPLIGAGENAKLRHDLYAAGFPGREAVGRFVGVKIVLAGLLLGGGILWLKLGAGTSPLTAAALLLGLTLVGLRGPDAIIGRRAKARRDRIDRGLPDALDLLVVCGEAGIGMDVALERVAVELRGVHPDLAQELAFTVSEMRLLPDRLLALRHMGERVNLDSVRAIASTLIQTARYGTPLGKALRVLTADIRLERQTRIEAQAARLPVLITVPMIAFVLPATTLVVAGPAFLQLFKALGSLGGTL